MAHCDAGGMRKELPRSSAAVRAGVEDDGAREDGHHSEERLGLLHLSDRPSAVLRPSQVLHRRRSQRRPCLPDLGRRIVNCCCLLQCPSFYRATRMDAATVCIPTTSATDGTGVGNDTIAVDTMRWQILKGM
ncbi:hypothetical protein E2562_026352 [Oryza meyeriana var. granulata]|uniref:Uncharacterized protein n=1 Tax=Oryza meyeriana var. granulata TaxID=110450 RepID=A0A6G1EZ19_9ORYZ|nr:hypothetical protein E2562_026352 [Oryza meyeriana var. granulata]